MHDAPFKITRPGPEFDYLRRLREGQIRNRLNPNSTTRTIQTPLDGVFVERPENPPRHKGSEAITRYVITGVFGDYVQGLAPGAPANEAVTIAKLHHTRRSTFHNQTIDGLSYVASNAEGSTRVATDANLNAGSAEASVSEAVTPSYNEGDSIYAYAPVGGTGVLTGTIPVTLQEEGSRTWLAPYRLMQVCINGQWRYMMMRASEPFGNAS